MSNAVTFEVDQRSMREFRRALQVYQRGTGKDAPQVVGRAAMNLAFRAAQFTPKANKEVVRQGIRMRSPYAVYKWDRMGKGKRVPRSEAALERAVERFLKGRAARVGFIMAGWVKAGRKLQSKLRGVKALKITGVSKRLGKGYGRLGGRSLDAFAEIINSSTSKSVSSGDALERYGGAGLRKALAFVSRDMREYGERMLAKNAAKFNRGR